MHVFLFFTVSSGLPVIWLFRSLIRGINLVVVLLNMFFWVRAGEILGRSPRGDCASNEAYVLSGTLEGSDGAGSCPYERVRVYRLSFYIILQTKNLLLLVKKEKENK